TVLDIIRDRAALQETKEVILGVASGLSFLHKINFVHRDITPKNILVSSSEPRMVVKGGRKLRLAAVSHGKELTENLLDKEDLRFSAEMILEHPFVRQEMPTAIRQQHHREHQDKEVAETQGKSLTIGQKQKRMLEQDTGEVEEKKAKKTKLTPDPTCATEKTGSSSASANSVKE
ncbi:hypothetical protein BGZ47_003736, partial [Haplosporangium gracile]